MLAEALMIEEQGTLEQCEQMALAQSLATEAPKTAEKPSTLFARPEDLECAMLRTETTSLGRPVDWRWLRAWLWLEGMLPARVGETDLIVRQVLECISLNPHEPTTPFMADLQRAYLLHRSATMQASEIEARLLAAETTEQIALQMHIAAAVIDAYHDVFFEVRPLLGCPSAVMHAVFPANIREKGIQGLPTFMKVVAYSGGPAILADALWYRDTPQPQLPKNLKKVSTEKLVEAQRWYSVHEQVLLDSIVPQNDRERMWMMQLPLVEMATARRP